MKLLISFIFLIVLVKYAFAVDITSINVANQTILISSTSEPHYTKSSFSINNNHYFIVSFKNAILANKSEVLYNKIPGIKNITLVQYSLNPNIVRCTIQTSDNTSFFVQTVQINDKKLVTIISPNVSEPSEAPRICTTPPPTAQAKRFKVFIDVGHGGYDPGGVGPAGLPESFVNLSVALKLAKYLREKGVSVELDRTSNVFVPLYTRTQLANESGANLFIGLYCNASSNPATHGTTTYYWHEDSYPFANYLENYISQKLGLTDDGTVKDNLYVIKFTTAMPAVLIEYAYISNPYEESLLGSTGFRNILSQDLANAIYNYFVLKKTQIAQK
ncbi:MAG: N-acetylmuramoyl-L-alanine amidase family protein [Desulfurella sp.]|uniref:N-acetylmuramoyl-L-alanine amidase family protein n=1 Tax=Desulfurella sp. TaxID=1962857 RepID=UPI003C8BD6B7